MSIEERNVRAIQYRCRVARKRRHRFDAIQCTLWFLAGVAMLAAGFAILAARLL